MRIVPNSDSLVGHHNFKMEGFYQKVDILTLFEKLKCGAYLTI